MAVVAPFRLSQDVLITLQTSQKGQPLQALLLGSRVLTPEGVSLTATRVLPFERSDQCVATLMGCYLDAGMQETLVGWALLLDKECPLAKLATAYFETFSRQLVRTIVANSSTEATNDIKNLAGEIVDLLKPMVGIIVVRDAFSGDFVTREFCAYKSEFSIDRITALLQEQVLSDVDLLAGADATSLPFYADMDGLTRLAMNELMDQLRAEELESPDTLSFIADDLNALAKGVRKTRRRRPSVSYVLENPTSPGPDMSKISRAVPVIPCSVEIITGNGSSFLDSISFPSTVDSLAGPLAASIAAKESALRLIYAQQTIQLNSYSEACLDHELLALIYKVLSQPDDVLVRKLSAIEDYEERLKKLGARLKNSLSPEELLRTLASIQNCHIPTPPSST